MLMSLEQFCIMSNRLPIRTIVEGDKTTKICVEDIYKLLNRIIEPFNKSCDEISEIIDSYHQECDGYEGEFIIGKGTSQPCGEDKFDEKIGNEIAFRKAKLNANIKKYKMISRIWNATNKFQWALGNELENLEKYITKDVQVIKKHNPAYLAETFDEYGRFLYL